MWAEAGPDGVGGHEHGRANGRFFLGILFGKIVDATGDYNYPLYLIAFLLLCSSLLWLVIDPTKEVVLG